jgi:dihydrofolate synthase/folylpolyglutamate synthase
LPVSAEAVRTGLLTAEIAGRFQVLPGRPTVVLDVAHNPHAAAVLDASLARLQGGGRTLAVFSMLADKDIEGVVRTVKARIDEWFIAPVDAARAADLAMLRGALTRAAALDPTTEARVLSNLRATLQDTTVIAVASRPSTIALADEVLYLADGLVVAHGTHDELMASSEEYAQLMQAFEHDRDELEGGDGQLGATLGGSGVTP